MFGLVGQEPVLFDTTVKENILLGKQGTKLGQEAIKDDQEVHIEAAKNANAHGFVSSMPEGYDTSVGECCIINLGQSTLIICVFRKSMNRHNLL